VELPKTDTTSQAVRYGRSRWLESTRNSDLMLRKERLTPPLKYRLGKRTDNRALTRSHTNLSVAMLTRSAFLCGLTLVLSVETTAEAVRADVLDGFASHFHRETVFSTWGDAPVERRPP
jgi:hypothetical protein